MSVSRSFLEILGVRPRSTAGRSTFMLGLGLAVGAVGAILLTPKTGSEVRRELADQTKTLVEAGKEGLGRLTQEVKQLAQQAQESVLGVADSNHATVPPPPPARRPDPGHNRVS